VLAHAANPEHSRAARLGHAETLASKILAPAGAKISKSLPNVGSERARCLHKSARLTRDVQAYDSALDDLIQYKSLETASAHASLTDLRVLHGLAKRFSCNAFTCHLSNEC
jgi:hypothetical protein